MCSLHFHDGGFDCRSCPLSTTIAISRAFLHFIPSKWLSFAFRCCCCPVVDVLFSISFIATLQPARSHFLQRLVAVLCYPVAAHGTSIEGFVELKLTGASDRVVSDEASTYDRCCRTVPIICATKFEEKNECDGFCVVSGTQFHAFTAEQMSFFFHTLVGQLGDGTPTTLTVHTDHTCRRVSPEIPSCFIVVSSIDEASTSLDIVSPRQQCALPAFLVELHSPHLVCCLLSCTRHSYPVALSIFHVAIGS